jgi:hypothetical protein
MGKLSVLFLFLLFLALIIAGGFILDFLGLLNFRAMIYPYLGKVPLIGTYFVPRIEPWEVIKEEELRRLRASIEERWRMLEEREEKLARDREELAKLEEELKLEREELQAQREALRERIVKYEEEEERLKRLASYYQRMRPAEAASILQELDDMTIINIFRHMPEGTVSIILMNMVPSRAAEITRKMSR